MMKINSTFHISVFLMAVLIFSVPFITFAQQNTGNVLAITEAKRDAEADVNKWVWRGAGVAALGCITLGFIGGILATDSYGGGFLGSGVGCLVPPISIYSYKSGPPPERLIGKSPEYVKVYTETYKSKVRQLRFKQAGSGCTLVIGSYLVTFMVLGLIRGM